MRIITGIAKGRKIKAPEGLDTRPTADRVKQSLFNIIAPRLYDARVLDLFAGTGNLGLEAISQGAGNCIFVEHNRNSYNILNENITLLEFEAKVEKYCSEAINVLNNLGKKQSKFDMIFLDPPYGKNLVDTSIKEIDKLELLSKGGIIVAESDINDIIPERIGKISVYRTVKYGRTKVSFWNREDKDE